MKTVNTFQVKTVEKQVRCILNAIIDDKKSHAKEFWVKYLKGDERYFSLTQIEQEPYLASLQNLTVQEIYTLIYFLIQQDFLKTKDNFYGLLEITQKGQDFLNYKIEIEIKPNSFQIWFEKLNLLKTLKEERKKISDLKDVPSYEIATNFQLEILAQYRPESPDEFYSISQTQNWPSAEHWNSFMQVIKDFNEAQKIYNLPENKVKRVTFQETKNLFLQGLTIEKIANTKNITVSTVLNYLETLHLAKEINLIPWIEENIEKESLLKASFWFKTHENQLLKAAKSELDLDYDTLRLGRLYANEPNNNLVA